MESIGKFCFHFVVVFDLLCIIAILLQSFIPKFSMIKRFVTSLSPETFAVSSLHLKALIFKAFINHYNQSFMISRMCMLDIYFHVKNLFKYSEYRFIILSYSHRGSLKKIRKMLKGFGNLFLQFFALINRLNLHKCLLRKFR